MPGHKRIKSVPEDIKLSKDRICQCDYVFCIPEGDDSLRVVSRPIPKNSQLVDLYCKATIQYPLSTHLRNRSVQGLRGYLAHERRPRSLDPPSLRQRR